MKRSKGQKKNLKELLNFSTPIDLEHDKMMIHFRYMKEIEGLMESNGEMTKRELAEKLHVSASFITQLFNGDKVLNFELLAKIQNIFKFDFFVTAEKRIPVTDEVPISHLASPKWAKAFPFKDLHGQCYSHMFMDNYRKVTLSDMDIDTFDPERKTA